MPRSPSLASASCWSCSAPPSRPGPLRKAPTAHVDLHTHSTASDGEFPPDEVARRGQQMVAKLRGLGVALDAETVTASAGSGALGRPHVARALVAGGHTADITEAFDRYLGRGRPAFVEKPLPALRDVARLVHAAGG